MSAITGKKLESIICPLCNESISKRITEFEKHLAIIHEKNSQQLWNELNNGPVLCACGCEESTVWLGWKKGYGKLLRGHNSNLEAVYGKEKALEIAKKRSDSLKGSIGWSKGLTKETDDRVKQRAKKTAIGRKQAFESGKITAWSKGLTKETDERVASNAEAIKESYKSGKSVPWAKGLTKKTNAKIMAMAQKVSLTHKTQNLRNRLDEIKRLNKEEIQARIESSSSLKVINDLNDYINDNTPNIIVECVKCQTKSIGTLRTLQNGRCHACDPGGSKSQAEVADWLENTINHHVERNTRSIIMGNIRMAELDIFVPAQKFAIEYNGLYWHSEIHKSNSYHENKSNSCRTAGISLFHVFEDEWRDKQDIVKSMILHKLNQTKLSIGARQCKILPVTSIDKKNFMNDNHIDGDTQSSYAFGLFHPTHGLVMVLSLRKPFHKAHKDTLEVARVCSKINLVVIGGLSRLTSHVKSWAQEQNINELMSYVDLRHGSTILSWEKSGWNRISTSPPRFWWTDFTNRYNRFKYKANSSLGMSEVQVAQEAGVYKIWGCGNELLKLQIKDC